MDEARKRTVTGAVLLVASTLLILGVVQSAAIPLLVGSIAAIGMVAGSVLIGTAAKGV
jgi:hypothetical protein